LYKGKKKVGYPIHPYPTKTGINLLLTLNPVHMEKMHTIHARESMVLTIITALLYFSTIMMFAYLFTMS